MKELIVLTGVANVGKSATLNRVFELLRERFPSMKEIAVLRRTRIEIRVVVEIDGMRVGIDSRGDRPEHVKDALDVLLRQRCSIIVCASHTRGGTIDEVRQFSETHRYSLFEVAKTAAAAEALHTKANNSYAKDIVSRIGRHLTAEPASV